MKITAAHIKNFKRVRDIEIHPDADRTLLLIGGKNGMGKSSVLDALTAAFGGKKAEPSDPIRHGSAAAEILLELDGGELTIRRVINSEGSTLEVRDRLGAVKSPQAILDKLVGTRFLDPLAFLALKPADQRVCLMRLIEGADRIAGLDDKRVRVFDKRTEVGRDLTKAEGELARLPDVAPGTPIDVDAITTESKQLAEMQRLGDGLGRVYEQTKHETVAAHTRLRETNAHIDRLEAQLEALKQTAIGMAEHCGTCEALESKAKAALEDAAAKWTELLPRRERLDADLKRASEHNRTVYAAEAQLQRRTEAAETVTKLSKEREDLTKVIETIDQRKAEILGAAKLPVDGLGLSDHGITLRGVPFEQSSRAEQLRVALGLAIAASPKLGDVWIRDGALLDDESLELVAQHAAAAGKKVWIERVGTRDPGVIVIHDGKVLSE